MEAVCEPPKKGGCVEEIATLAESMSFVSVISN